MHHAWWLQATIYVSVKTCRFKTLAPLRDQSLSPCAHAHVQHLQSFHYCMPRRQHWKRPSPLCEMTGAKTEFTFRLLVEGPLNHTLESIGQYPFVKWEMTPFPCNYNNKSWSELNECRAMPEQRRFSPDLIYPFGITQHTLHKHRDYCICGYGC